MEKQTKIVMKLKHAQKFPSCKTSNEKIFQRVRSILVKDAIKTGKSRTCYYRKNRNIEDNPNSREIARERINLQKVQDLTQADYFVSKYEKNATFIIKQILFMKLCSQKMGYLIRIILTRVENTQNTTKFSKTVFYKRFQLTILDINNLKRPYFLLPHLTEKAYATLLKLTPLLNEVNLNFIIINKIYDSHTIFL